MKHTDLKADLFTGRVNSLHNYKAIRSQQNTTPNRWVIYNESAGTIYGVGQGVSKHPLTAEEIANVPAGAVWRIVDHSAGKRITKPDEV